MSEPVGNNPSPFQELKVTEVRAGLEVLAFCRPDSLQLVVDGAPAELGVTVEELAIFLLARELLGTSVRLHELAEKVATLEALVGAGRN
jgi:hypothetical protein